MPEPTNDPPDAFAEFLHAAGLSDLADLNAATAYPEDDAITAEDDEGDSLTIIYRERTAEDGELVGVVAISTGGPTGVALLGWTAMRELSEWFAERAARARVLEEEQK